MELREEENFAELYARDVTRKALRGIRETAREGHLKVGSSPLEPNLQLAMERAVQINDARKRKREEEGVKIIIPTAAQLKEKHEQRKKQKTDLFEEHMKDKTGVTKVISGL